MVVAGPCGAQPVEVQRYVDKDATGSGDGETWTDAFTDLQEAIEFADFTAGSSTTVVIWVATGTYHPSQSPEPFSTSPTFLLPRYTMIYGGFAGGETDLIERDPASNVATLDGRHVPLGEEVEQNAESVVIVDEEGHERRLDGFTVTNPEEYAAWTNRRNVAVRKGGVALVNLVVREGYADRGGGINITTINPGTRVVSCTVVDNESQRLGGGIAIQGPAEIVNSLLARNVTLACPGGICHNHGGSAIGALESTAAGSLINCTISRNEGSSAVYIDSTASLDIINSIIWGNTGEDCELDDPEEPECGLPEINGVATVSWSNVRDGYAGGTAIMDADPLFVDAGAGNFRLSSASPCLDAGLSSVVPEDDLNVDDDESTIEPTPDLDRASRVVPALPGDCPEVDMGAFERMTDDDCLTGDLNDDCEVDGADLGLLLGAWGTTGPGDLDCDGEVTGADLGILLGGWSSELDTPRECGCESLLGGGSSASLGAPLTAAELSAFYGFDSVAAFTSWLGSLPLEEIEAYLSPLME
jgi:hypothetical protein